MVSRVGGRDQVQVKSPGLGQGSRLNMGGGGGGGQKS